MFVAFQNERPAPSVLSQPEVELFHWRVLQRTTGSLHITTQLESGSFRVTSALVAVNLVCKFVMTESGRNYRLCAPPEEEQPLLSLLMVNGMREMGAASGDVNEVIWRAISTQAWAEGERLLPSFQ